MPDPQCSRCKRAVPIGYFKHDFNLCDRCAREVYPAYIARQTSAAAQVLRALKAGKIERPATCELCGNGSGKMVAHHWNGYDDPLNVWHICQSCNIRLAGRRFHIGLITKEQARLIVQGQTVTVEFGPRR